jgi:hypothetical protein
MARLFHAKVQYYRLKPLQRFRSVENSSMKQPRTLAVGVDPKPKIS